MSCKNQQSETRERDDATGSSRPRLGSACPCGGCPQKAKWVCLAGLAAALGLVTFQALRRPTAAS